MEDIASSGVDFSDDKLENMQYFSENEDEQGISNSLPKFLKASELCSLRSYINKNKSDSEDMEVSKGPKLYYQNDASDEVVASITEVVKKSLELQRISKNRDCIKAEWNAELKVAFVPFLKKKSAQHMGISVKGKYALLPEEALFLLEKGLIEVIHNQMPLSVEEAYAVMLQGRLAVENYEVYSFLSQLGYIVVHNQSRIRSCYEKILSSLPASTTRKRKNNDSVELPEQKRVTFSGLLASNANKISFSKENLDHSLNSSEPPNSAQSVPEETDCLVSSNQDENNKVPKMNEKTSENSKEATISLDSTCVEIYSSQNEAQISCNTFEGKNDANAVFVCSNNSEKGNLNGENGNNTTEGNTDVCENIDNSNIENGRINKEIKNDDTKIVNDGDDIDVVNFLDENLMDIDLIDNVKNPENENEKSVKISQDKSEINKENDETEIDVENTNDDNETEHGQDYIDVELTEEIGVDTNNGDTNDVIIEKEHTGKQNGRNDELDDINVEDSRSNDYSKDYESSDDSTSIVCDESNDRSIDVYSISPGRHQNKFGDSKKDNLPANDQDDEVTLVEVKKKETKPLAVIDLLSDEEDISDESKNRGDKQSSEEEIFEDSDEEIQVLNVLPVAKNTLNSTVNRNSVKLETKKLKIPVDVKTAYIPKLKFPDAFKKDMLCIPRPPDHVLPFKVQPCKEAYVLTFSRTQQKKKMWNSYRDMQDYQRDRRLGRLTRSPFKSQPGLFSNRSSPYSVPESSRSDGFIRGDQNPSYLPSLLPSPINQGESNLERQMNSFKSRLNSLRDQSSPVNVPESSRDDGFVRSDRDYSYIQNLHQPSPMNHLQRPSFPRPNIFNPQNHMPFAMNLNNLQNLSSNPAAFVNEIQKTVYSVATSMISSMIGQHLHPNSSSPLPNLPFSESGVINVTSHVHNSNFTTSSSYPSPFMYNSSGRNDIPPMRFPAEPVFSSERYPSPMYDSYSAGNNWRQPSNFRQRNFAHRGPSFPCTYRTVRRKRDWHDVKAAVEGTADSDSGSDIVEVPIDMNQFLWSNDIQPMIARGSKLPVVADLQKELRITEMANLCDTKRSIERYLPVTLSLEISFDVYLPNSKFKRSEPCVPNYRIIVVRSYDQIPKYSELVDFQRKYDDGASLQIAVVDHSDISFYSFNSVYLPEMIPFDS